MKHKIMQVLLSADNNLTKEEIQWAITNIPDNGIECKFNHDADNIWDACGFNHDTQEQMKKEFVSLGETVVGLKKSHIVEHLLTNGSPMLIRNFAIRGLCHHIEKMEDSAIEKLKKLIEKYK